MTTSLMSGVGRLSPVAGTLPHAEDRAACGPVLGVPVEDRSDAQLLDEFIERRDELAFEELVRRHAPMVRGVCKRFFRDYHDAEEAFQDTFLVLLRKAAGVSPREKVGHWLYGVARNRARKGRAATARRRRREVPVPQVPDQPTAPPEPLHDLWPQVEQELSRLPDKYREPIVQCLLEGKSGKEAAQQLGCPEGTASGRLCRGLALLKERLKHLVLPAALALILFGSGISIALAQCATTLPATAPAPQSHLWAKFDRWQH